MDTYEVVVEKTVNITETITVQAGDQQAAEILAEGQMDKNWANASVAPSSAVHVSLKTNAGGTGFAQATGFAPAAPASPVPIPPSPGRAAHRDPHAAQLPPELQPAGGAPEKDSRSSDGKTWRDRGPLL